MKFTALFAGATLLLAGMSVQAEEKWPTKPIHLVVPYAGGGGTDTTVRVLSARVAKILGQPIVVQNKPGGGTIIATQAVASASPDGYTIGAAAAPLTLNEALGVETPYNAMNDLEHIIKLVDVPACIFLNPSHPAKDLRQFVEWAKAQKQPILYATAGIGSLPHLWTEYLATRLGFRVEHVGYAGSARALTDLIGGSISVMVDGYTPSCMRSKTGEVRALAVAWDARLPVLPDVPTFKELGFEVDNGAANFGLIAPKNTPADIVVRINAAYNEALKDPEIRKTLETGGLLPAGGSPDDYRTFLRREVERWKKVVSENGIKAQ